MKAGTRASGKSRSKAPVRMMPAVRACRKCGCTDDNACMTDEGPCRWVGPELCSACESEPKPQKAQRAIA